MGGDAPWHPRVLWTRVARMCPCPARPCRSQGSSLGEARPKAAPVPGGGEQPPGHCEGSAMGWGHQGAHLCVCISVHTHIDLHPHACARGGGGSSSRVWGENGVGHVSSILGDTQQLFSSITLPTPQAGTGGDRRGQEGMSPSPPHPSPATGASHCQPAVLLRWPPLLSLRRHRV